MNALQPGDWTPTGWGAQHRIRASDERYTELVCHTTIQPYDPDGKRRTGESHRCETPRINRAADESDRCRRCEAMPGLGPIVYAPRGEVRRSPDGEVAVCIAEPPGNAGSDLSRAAGRGWRLITDEQAFQCHGWRGDWDVVTWQTIGNVFTLAEAAGSPPQPSRAAS